jgi:hypothetical protein
MPHACHSSLRSESERVAHDPHSVEDGIVYNEDRLRIDVRAMITLKQKVLQ